MDRKLKQVTLKDLADRLGVSAMTVSRALSGKEHLVSPETAERCKDVAREMGYLPNLMARSLRGEQLSTIVLFAEHISSHHYLAELVDEVSQSIEGRRYSVINCQSISSFHQSVRNFRLAGAVVLAPPEEFYKDPFGEREYGAHRHCPTVLIHSAAEQNVFSEVSPDIIGFCYQGAAHLLELGHREIAYLGGPRADDEPRWFELRRRGIERAFVERGVPVEILHHQACPDASNAPLSFQKLHAQWPDATAVMCINDEIALGCIQGAKELGLSVPGRLSVLGCNDIQIAQFFQPMLTTFAIDIRGMVRTALDLLFDEISDRREVSAPEPIKIRLPAQFVLRQSTGRPPEL